MGRRGPGKAHHRATRSVAETGPKEIKSSFQKQREGLAVRYVQLWALPLTELRDAKYVVNGVRRYAGDVTAMYASGAEGWKPSRERALVSPKTRSGGGEKGEAGRWVGSGLHPS